MYEARVFEYQGKRLEYVIDYPEGYSPDQRYPVILYLHGYGFVNGDIEKIKAGCPLRRERIPSGMPFVLIAPHCDKTSWVLEFETLCGFIEYVYNAEFCDKSRVYLTGSSMGGYTAWLALMAKKQVFAAAVICCGGGQYWANFEYVDMPIRLVHGALDRTVLPRESEIMAERINAIGGKVELTVHESLAHDVWTVTFSDPKTYEWLLSNKKEIL
ncbi:MAG: prolyl oligopeptidase family serine peptidase [Clostridia bacterium]|nr:prolyl oligopeptidase family serine peptidase [Clostridia bacterium]